jgi:hypothetical protein
MLKLLGVLLVIWLLFVVIGAVVHALFWLLVIGAVLFVATGAIGWAKREAITDR